VTITDTGSGIPPEDLKHIFDPFFSRKDNGTGLGLAIVQGIVEQHKGKVKITSKVGVGTTVKVELPIDEVVKG
jgi:signal transduction histidine kinase